MCRCCSQPAIANPRASHGIAAFERKRKTPLRISSSRPRQLSVGTGFGSRVRSRGLGFSSRSRFRFQTESAGEKSPPPSVCFALPCRCCIGLCGGLLLVFDYQTAHWSKRVVVEHVEWAVVVRCKVEIH
ncbi:hypothetical protein IQ07DRAFT_436808 [Pyrenochaeta sp. DS3sAY3a]|nr:hypothetical protein IQ07DRAFT_436808 [Pyrenochaeta sp. DS3sAY3a]